MLLALSPGRRLPGPVLCARSKRSKTIGVLFDALHGLGYLEGKNVDTGFPNLIHRHLPRKSVAQKMPGETR